MTDLHRYDPRTWVETMWAGMYHIHPQSMSEESWDDLMSALNWITEDLGFEWDTQPDSPTNGELIRGR